MKFICTTIALALLTLTPPVKAGTTNDAAAFEAQCVELTKKIESKFKPGKNTEADFANELKAFDQLIATATAEKLEQAPKLLHLKAELYEDILNDPEKCVAVFQKLAADYPDTAYGKNAIRRLPPLMHQLEIKKIEDSLAVGQRFPDFSEKDFNGQPLSVGALKGKVVLVDFWATWCVPCQIELPNVAAAYKKFHSKGLEIIGVTLDVKSSDLTKFLKKKDQFVWPEFFDAEVGKLADKYDSQELPYQNKLALKYGIEKIPANFLISADGIILGKDLRGKALLTAIADALEKK